MEPDFVLEAVVRSGTASDAIGLCSQLLRQEGTGLSAVTALLERLRMGMEEEAGVRTILQGIRGACAPPSAICDQLLQLLPIMTPPTAVVEALPHFVGEDPGVVSSVLREYKELLEGDRSMVVHVIGSLHDLPLDANARQEVSAMTLEALSVVDEEDVPVVVRTLFKTARERDSAAVVARVRAECARLGMTALAVLVDVLADTFSFNESVARAFLAEITASVVSCRTAGGTAGGSAPFGGESIGNGDDSAAEEEDDEEEEEEGKERGSEEEEQPGDTSLSTLDVVGFLLLLLHRRHVTAVHHLLEQLSRRPERLPADAIVALAERSGKPPWECLAGPIRELGLWAAMAIPAPPASRASTSGASVSSAGGTATVGNGGGGGGFTKSGGSSSSKAADSSRAARALVAPPPAPPLLRRAGSRILLAVFRGQPNARAPIVSCCLGVVGTHRLPAGNGVGVGARAGWGVERDNSSVRTNDALLETCLGALDLLLDLSEKCAALMSPYANTVGDMVLGGGGRSLHPRLLDKAARCLASLTRHSGSNGTGMVNELMNHVQKQIFFLGAGGGGGGGGGGMFRGGFAGGGLQAGHGMGRSGGEADAQRRSAIVLATHLIKRGALEKRDEDALFGWAVRLLSLLRGGPSSSSLDTVALTLDLLVAATSSDPLDNSSTDGRGSSSRGGGASSDGIKSVDHRREGWRRAGAAAAGRCLAGMGFLRFEESDGGGGGWCRGGSARRRGAPPSDQHEVLVDVASARPEEEFPGEGAAGTGKGTGAGSMSPRPPSPPPAAATLCVRDVATVIWREGSTPLSYSARSLHSSWFSAITLSCQGKTGHPCDGEPSLDGGGGHYFPGHHRAAGGGGEQGSVWGAGNDGGAATAADVGVIGGGGDSWLRARLSMPPWPFSDDSYGGGGGGEEPIEDSGGYWPVNATAEAGLGGYSPWRIPAAECAWQGSEGTQQLVEAGAACVAARSLLAAAARHLLQRLRTPGSSPPSLKSTNAGSNISGSNGSNGCNGHQGARAVSNGEGRFEEHPEDTAAAAAAAAARENSAGLLSNLAWRYLELGARGRVCVAALRRRAREMAGNGGGAGGGSSRGGLSEGVGGSAAVEEEDRAAARLEEGLSAEPIPLECLCRLVTAGVESRVAATTAAAATGTTAVSSSLGNVYPGDGGEDKTRLPAEKSAGAAGAAAEATMGGMMGSVRSPSVVLMAYVELLRTLASRLEKGDIDAGGGGEGCSAALDADAGGGRRSEAAGADGVWAGVKAMDVEALLRGTVTCSKALPIVRKVMAFSKTASSSSQPPSSRVKPKVAPKRRMPVSSVRPGGNHGRGGTGGGGEVTAKRQKRSDGSGSADGARWLGSGSVRRREAARRRSGGGGGLRTVMEGVDGDDLKDESEEGEDGGDLSSSEESSSSSLDSYDTDDEDDDVDSLSDESAQEPDEQPRRQTSTPRGKNRSAAAATAGGGAWGETPGSARRSGGAGPSSAAARAAAAGAAGGWRGEGADDEVNPWESMPGLSLCQFWRYRLLLEVVLTARGGGGQAGGGVGEGEQAPRLAEVLKRLAPVALAGNGDRARHSGGQAVFLELSGQLDKAEDGLLAGMVTELMAALSLGCPQRAEEAAALSWKGLGALYPRGYGEGYSHLGGVLAGLRRGGTSLTSSPVALRYFLDHACGASSARLRGQLTFPPQLQLGNPATTGLLSLPFLQHALLSHWALSGRSGRPWALAATVLDIEAFVLRTPGSGGNSNGESGSKQHPGKRRPPPFPSHPAARPPLLCQDNFDVFVAAVIKLLPASLAIAAPRTPAAAAAAAAATSLGGLDGAVPVGVPSSPYEEVEGLGMVFECLVEACTESLGSGAWNSSAGTEELTALGRLLRRFVLPVAACSSKALRALENQLGRSLAWRNSQTLAPKGFRDRRRDSAAQDDGYVERVDYGSARLCRGLLEQCDLCADAVRALCAAVRAVTLSEISQDKDAAAGDKPASTSKPHRAALDRVAKILPGIVLQSDQLSAAVDSARGVLQLPRKPAAGSGDNGEAGRDKDKDDLSPPDHQRRQRQRRRPASERLLARFAAVGGGQRRGAGAAGAGAGATDIAPGGAVAAQKRRRQGAGKRPLTLGSELRGPRARAEPSRQGKNGLQGPKCDTARVASAASTSATASTAPSTKASLGGDRPQERPSLVDDGDKAAAPADDGGGATAAVAAGDAALPLEGGGVVGVTREVAEDTCAGGCGEGAERGGKLGGGGYEAIYNEEEEEEEEEEGEEEVDQFRAVGGWGTY